MMMFGIGLVVGACIGVVLMSLLAINGRYN